MSTETESREVVPHILVSVTTIPRRFAQSLPAVIASIQRQTLRVKIIVNVSDNYVKWPGTSVGPIPEAWTHDPDILVYTTSRDYGPATKLLGAIEFLAAGEERQGIVPSQITHILTIDDDIDYTDTQFIQRFVDAIAKYPRYVLPIKSICLGCAPYHHCKGLIYDREGFVDVPRGFHGVAYPLSELAPDRFYMSPEFIGTLIPEVFNDDDAFFGIILGIMNVPIFVINHRLETGSVDAGESAVQENSSKNRMTAEMEIYQFAVQRGYLPNKHRLAADQKETARDRAGMQPGWCAGGMGMIFNR